MEAQQKREPLDLRDLTPFDWDRVLVYVPGTPRSAISRALGFEFKGDLPYTAESSEVFVFTNRGRVRALRRLPRARAVVGLARPFER